MNNLVPKRNMRNSLKIVICLLLLFTVMRVRGLDPCVPGSHDTFPSYLGSRNEHCNSQDAGTQPCDKFLIPGWYVTPDATILTTCPASGDCGVSFPAWMNGTLPVEADNIVTRTVCVKQGWDCCSVSVEIQVKKCSGFFVYYLERLPECYSVYCFESDFTCDEPTATKRTTTETTTPAATESSTGLTESVSQQADPCDPSNHATFPVYLGSRNEHCQSPATGSQPCDMFLIPGWYVTPDAIILTHCPSSGDCGVSYPAWMNGTLPNVADDIVTRTVCVKQGWDCCSVSVEIQVKKCYGFFVYYLERLPECYSVYCFESQMSCVKPTTLPPTTTRRIAALHTTVDSPHADVPNRRHSTDDKVDSLKDTVDGLVIGLAIGWATTAVMVFVIIKLCIDRYRSKVGNSLYNEEKGCRYRVGNTDGKVDIMPQEGNGQLINVVSPFVIVSPPPRNEYLCQKSP